MGTQLNLEQLRKTGQLIKTRKTS